MAGKVLSALYKYIIVKNVFMADVLTDNALVRKAGKEINVMKSTARSVIVQDMASVTLVSLLVVYKLLHVTEKSDNNN